MKIISQLNTAKTCQNADTPTKIIKLNKDIFAKFISNNFNHCIDEGKFSYELKHADVIQQKLVKMQILLPKSLNLIKIFLQNLSVITSTTVLMKVSFHMN